MTTLYHRYDGPEDAPLLVLSNSVGSTLELWDPQIPAFAGPFRVLRYDQLGHGRSPVPPGPYTAEQLGCAVLDLVDAERFSFCGLSLGGVVGMWLAANAPERIDRLVLAATSANFGPPSRWDERIAQVRAEGMGPIADGSMTRWFTPAFAGTEPYRRQVAETPAEGYIACMGALGAWDFRAELGRIDAPTLAVAGADDPSTPPSDLEEIAAAVPGARLVVIPHASHLVNVEQPEAFNHLVLDHLTA
jgi:3-oxoadipate enol-lactonase